MTQAATSPANVSVRYTVARTLLREGDYGQVLNAVLDTAIEAIGADRGFILVRDGAGYGVAAARKFASDSLRDAEAEVSTTIAASVEQQRRAVLIGDAQQTAQYRNQASVRQ